MTVSLDQALSGLPDTVQRVLRDVVAAAQQALGPNLRCLALFGSGAEKRLRATSDVNLLFVLAAFEQAQVDGLRAELRTAEAAARVDAMFLLERELPLAAEAFAGKFADIRRRHVILHGDDLVRGLEIPRRAAIFRNRQLLLNLILRLRHAYVLQSLREEQAALVVAEAAAPLRAAAASLAELKGGTVESPRAALESFVATLPERDWPEVLGRLTEARVETILPPGVAGPTILRLVALAEHLRAAFDALSSAEA
jgi:hypothetical protein